MNSAKEVVWNLYFSDMSEKLFEQLLMKSIMIWNNSRQDNANLSLSMDNAPVFELIRMLLRNRTKTDCAPRKCQPNDFADYSVFYSKILGRLIGKLQ